MAQTNEYLVELYNWIQSKDSSFIDRFTFDQFENEELFEYIIGTNKAKLINTSSQWLKYEIPEGVYYLRVPGYAVEGDVGAKNAIIQLMDPYMGKHYYPTGIEYGSDEHFPERIVDHAVKKIRAVAQDLQALTS